MSDCFDHELDAFSRWENGECDEPDGDFFISENFISDFEEDEEDDF